MQDHTSTIIASFIVGGLALSFLIGRALRAKKRWAVAIGAPFFAIGIGMVALFGAASAQEICHKKFAVCLGTSDTNVWNFAVYPLLSIPVYWVLMLIARRAKQ